VLIIMRERSLRDILLIALFQNESDH
jgi:hypothetical protein